MDKKKMALLKRKVSSKLSNLPKAPLCLILVCILLITVTTILIAGHIRSFPDAGVKMLATARNSTSYKVYYIENDLFDSGERPSGISYLVSFTDYVELRNTFSAEFAEETEASYRCTVTETLVIRHQRSTGRTGNSTVYEESFFHDEIAGSATGRRISFNGSEEGEPGGDYIVDIEKHIDAYRRFLQLQQRQMYRAGLQEDRPPGFSAEVLVDFSYNLRVPELGINETITRGFSIPFSSEIFVPEDTGTPTFELSEDIRGFEMPGIAVIAPIVLWYVLNVIGVFYGIRRLMPVSSDRRRELIEALRKYSDEISVLQ